MFGDLPQLLNEHYPPVYGAVDPSVGVLPPIRPQMEWPADDYDQDVDLPIPGPIVRVEMVRENGSEQWGQVIPYTIPWWEYVRLVVHKNKDFSEAKAQQYCNIKPKAFRKVRDAMMANERDWAYWINPDHHQQGIGFTPEGWAALVGIAALPRPTDALPRTQGPIKHVRTSTHA
jgi:hypothetical protein